MANPVLQFLITARDEATSSFKKIFRFLDSEVSVVAGKVRDAFTGIFGGGLDGAIEFEAQLDKVQAKGGYTAASMEALKKAAVEIGAQFGITGTEAAQGMESLAAAGLDATQVMQALPPVLALAKVEALSMDQASGLLANSLTTVGLGFDQAGRLANVLTQAANESTTSAAAVGAALETTGGIARTAGLSLEQTVAALTGLAKGGIEGEKAGTALAAILTQLLNPASAASKELGALGITSRDFSTVIGELEKRGAGANTAILAFGETAGPGLRSLIAQGKTSLSDLEKAMLGSAGAAQNAADQMSGNLKTALSGLVSAWENVKSALFDPVLEPIAQAARDASHALNDNLNNGALKPVQDAIKSFTEQGVIAVREFISNFDFKTALTSVQGFATNAAESFDNIKNAGQTAADVITLAWNSVTAGFKTIGAGLLGVASSVLGNLSAIEAAAAKVGLGSVERANELNEKALALKARASELLQQVETDGRQIATAFDRMTGATENAATAQEKLKTALPVAELQSLTYTLEDYRKIAERANQAVEQAAQDHAAGKITAQEYGQKLLEAAQANAALEAETKKQTAATKASATAADDAATQQTRLRVEMEARQKQETALLGLAEQFRSAQEASARAATQEAQAALELARAKGDERAIREALLEVQQREVEEAKAGNVTRQAELQILESKRRQLIELAGGTEKLSAAQRLELATLDQTITAKQRDIAAGESWIEVQRLEAEAAERAAGPIGKLIRLYEDKTEAAGLETAAIERGYNAKIRDVDVEIAQAEAKGDVAKAAELRAEKAQLEAEAAQAVADATRQEAEAQIDLLEAKRLDLLASDQSIEAKNEEIAKLDELIAKQREAIDASQDQADAKKAEADAQRNAAQAAQASGEAQEAAGEKAQIATAGALANVRDLIEGYAGLTEAGRRFAESMSVRENFTGVNGLIAFGNAVDQARLQVLAALEAEEQLNAEVDRLSEIADGAGDAARYAHEELLQMARNGGDGIRGLTEAGEQAKQKLNEIRNAALGAEQALSAMAQDYRKQILQLQGDEATLLKLEQQDRLKQLEDLYARSGQLGSEEYQQAKARAEELHRLKMAQLAAENAARAKDQQTTRTTASATTSAGAANASATPTKKYQLDLTAGTQKLSAFTDIDPQAFLDALMRAKRVAM